MKTVAIIASDAATCERLVTLIPTDTFHVQTSSPTVLPSPLPDIFVISLTALDTPEEQLIERLRADDATAAIPIIIVSGLPMVELQSVPYASDWTIAIVEDGVEQPILLDTMTFLLNPEGAP